MAATEMTTGILLRDVAHVHEVHDAMTQWLDIQREIEAFDQETHDEANGVDGKGCLASKDFPACYGVQLSREEVRGILVQRREKAEMTLANKGVKVGRMEGVR